MLELKHSVADKVMDLCNSRASGQHFEQLLHWSVAISWWEISFLTYYLHENTFKSTFPFRIWTNAFIAFRIAIHPKH